MCSDSEYRALVSSAAPCQICTEFRTVYLNRGSDITQKERCPSLYISSNRFFEFLCNRSRKILINPSRAKIRHPLSSRTKINLDPKNNQNLSAAGQNEYESVVPI